MNRVPCHKSFVVYFEHVRDKPEHYVGPLGDFLELSEGAKSVSVS